MIWFIQSQLQTLLTFLHYYHESYLSHVLPTVNNLSNNRITGNVLSTYYVEKKIGGRFTKGRIKLIIL